MNTVNVFFLECVLAILLPVSHVFQLKNPMISKFK